MERRKNVIKVGFAILKLKIRSSDVGLKVGLKVGKNVGKKVGFSSGPDSNNISLNIKIDEFSFIYRFCVLLLETMKETNFFISKRL